MADDPRTQSTTTSSSRLDDAADDGAVPSPVDSLKSAGRYFAEFQAFLGHYLSAKADLLKLSVRKIVMMVALGVVGLIIGGAALATAGVMLLVGLANAIGAIFEPDKPWVGQLIVSVLVIGGVIAMIMMVTRKMTGASKARTVAKYEAKRADQRAHFGEDVAQRASQAPNN